MRNLLLSSAMALALATPAFAAGNSAHSGQSAGKAMQSQAGNQQASDWIRVTSAENLVGRDVRTKDGKDAGRIDGIVLDIPQGDVVYLLIGSGGQLDIGNDRIAVPFGVLQTPVPADEDAAVVVNQDLGKLRDGKRISNDRYGDLGNESTMKQVYGSYGIGMPSGYLVPPMPGRDQHRYMLVRPDEVSMLGDSGNMRAQNVRGTDVLRPNGDDVGEIDQVVIDPASGRVPYLLLSSGGFLGIGNDWVPVPPQALSWSSDKDAFVLKDKGLDPTAMQALRKSDLPARVARTQVQTLYERFDVTPYWDKQQGKDKG
ncbi:MAG: hypothetical protein BGO51_23705 [Rhodospirillales bacterium 69-11]|nr:PRC-barrel domain-containing protein [Rhodospirillales bacterium]OJW22810.1 MAG: hypothetical protein BGO51_23705 [Rhodospirillales bacterium 69-11]